MKNDSPVRQPQFDMPSHGSDQSILGVDTISPTKIDAVSPEGGKHPHSSSYRKLIMAALGVVYGDIGTSPLYAFRECFNSEHGIPLTSDNIFGMISLIFWSLTFIVMVKYLIFILRADNRGEGGIMALIALMLSNARNKNRRNDRHFLVIFGIFGAALLYGDGIITPAISVLSAVEGLQIAAPSLKPIVVAVTVSILVLLFAIQSRGTTQLGAIFGPTMLIWFLTLIAIAAPWILKRPDILLSANPFYAVQFFVRNGLAGFFVLSAVVLCVTGAEALYADMGHFGKEPIRAGWFMVVFPSLILNYFGQGALLLENGPSALENPFYGLVSGAMVYPLIAIATLATVIASQALISGTFSLTQQAIQLGYLPRTRVLHTSRETEGQIFISKVNQFLMIGSIGLVLLFRHSEGLAAAYGIAVTGTMMITSILFYEIARYQWKWKTFYLVPLVSAFLLVDLSFFFANLRKFLEGGWIPILIAAVLFVVMTTWRRGRDALSKAVFSFSMPLPQFFSFLQRKRPARVNGSAIFMTLAENIAPAILLHHLKHNQVLHETVVLLTIQTVNEPYVEASSRIQMTELKQGFYKVTGRFGFMETPDISEVLIFCLGHGLPMDIHEISFYLGRESILPTGSSGLFYWKKKLFILLSRNARPATDYFGLPADQVIEIGFQVAI